MSERFGVLQRVPPWIRHEHLARYHFASRFVENKTVVDAACGEGIGSEIFAKCAAVRVEAFDVSEKALAEAHKKAPLPNLHFRQASCLELPLQNGFADVYISLETLEHIGPDRLFLAEVVRILKPDGLFICSTPDRRFTNPGTALTDKPDNPFHVREYDREEFLGLLGGFFRHIELFGQNPRSERRRRFLEWVARYVSPRTAVRLNQALKAPLLFFDRYASHEVQKAESAGGHEYLVAVCSNART